VQPGDTYLVPGGVPHALGEGVFLVEIQEPSDLVVRFEFERGGYLLPESARFMNRGLDFCLDLFDFTARPLTDVLNHQRCRPRLERTLGPSSREDRLIGPAETSCFGVTKLYLAGETVARDSTSASILIVTSWRSHPPDCSRLASPSSLRQGIPSRRARPVGACSGNPRRTPRMPSSVLIREGPSSPAARPPVTVSRPDSIFAALTPAEDRGLSCPNRSPPRCGVWSSGTCRSIRSPTRPRPFIRRCTRRTRRF
jgi:hypothetical protein